MIPFDSFSDICQGIYVFQDDFLQVSLALPGASWTPPFGTERFALEVHLNEGAVLCLELVQRSTGWDIEPMSLMCPDGDVAPDGSDELAEKFLMRLANYLLTPHGVVFLWN